ncbi:protein of unknown function [Cupriavidus taiwanensis]|nr:protein of unknown function [Cupriavidus taiwanensis]
MFFGESMFAHRTDASKIALAALCAFLGNHGVAMIDCQQETDHLASLVRAHPPRRLRGPCARGNGTAGISPWRFDKSVLERWPGHPPRRQPEFLARVPTLTLRATVQTPVPPGAPES